VRGRSLAHIRALIDVGADLRAVNHDGISLFRYAQLHGRIDVLDILRDAGVSEPLMEEEQFVVASARADEATARDILARSPNIFARLTSKQLQTMPELAAAGQLESVRTILTLSWPREVKVGWDATALNWAVFHGNPTMAELLLHEGADWRTRHAYRDNVIGTLSWASRQEFPDDPAYGDVLGCACVLVAHGIPLASFEDYDFSPELSGYLDSVRLREPVAKSD
jgi:ankyrin repeat protein